ncbi:CDP-alcohol phosphatidyltransferase family protein [Halobiforma nitratireducens]|uniref:CDP-alcohol phosphatidyltransferase family protein n=1 Tax=Halobiforma nitratireducens TaxID=130048 RepID=UPI0012684526|nr:CDP-alcohol phosphatidyltransferase family protein [Halobiforma nitratireducens]
MIDGSYRRADTAVLSQWGRGTAGLVVLVAVALAVLEVQWVDGPSTTFLLGTAVTVGVVGTVLLGTVVRARHAAGNQPFTLATWVTVTRGAAVAVLAGFVLASAPPVSDGGPIGWLPVGLFAVAAGLDAIDGPIARATDAETELGARLDVEMDGLVVLVGTLVAVGENALPAAFLAVAVARHAFVAGTWLRARRGRPVRELPPNGFRRPLGALAMVAVAVALVPIVDPSVSRLVGTAVAVPFLLNFTWDWLAVTGRVSPD